MDLEVVYEEDFLTCSYGFRPVRSAHQALEHLRELLMGIGDGWVLEVDIPKFVDILDHGWLRDIVQRRVRDGVLLHLIGKWLNAGVEAHLLVRLPSIRRERHFEADYPFP